jgi:hypothetical protein
MDVRIWGAAGGQADGDDRGEPPVRLRRPRTGDGDGVGTMRAEGFEALADGTLLLAVLLVASSVVIALSAPTAAPDRGADLRYAEDVRLALFRTTMDGLGLRDGDGSASMPNGTTVETFLRVQVHLRADGVPGAAFHDANGRIADLAGRLVRPGWGVAITGRLVGGSVVVRIPDGADLPATYAGSGWTYPSLDGSSEDAHLAVAVWLTPPR